MDKMFWFKKTGFFWEKKLLPYRKVQWKKCQIPLLHYLLHPRLIRKATLLFFKKPKLHFKMGLNASRIFTRPETLQMYLLYATVAKLDKCAFPALWLPVPYHPLLLPKGGRDVLLWVETMTNGSFVLFYCHSYSSQVWQKWKVETAMRPNASALQKTVHFYKIHSVSS